MKRFIFAVIITTLLSGAVMAQTTSGFSILLGTQIDSVAFEATGAPLTIIGKATLTGSPASQVQQLKLRCQSDDSSFDELDTSVFGISGKWKFLIQTHTAIISVQAPQVGSTVQCDLFMLGSSSASNVSVHVIQ